MEKLKNILAESLMVEPENVSGGMKFQEHPNWDSLGMLTVMASISDDFGVEVSATEVKNANTVDELFALISGKKS